jgi:hypothetical protein
LAVGNYWSLPCSAYHHATMSPLHID